MFMVIAILRKALPAEHVSKLKPLYRRILRWQSLLPVIAVLAGFDVLYGRFILNAGDGKGEARFALPRRVLLIAGYGSIALFLLYFVLNSNRLLPKVLASDIGYLRFSKNWGTRRGGTYARLAKACWPGIAPFLRDVRLRKEGRQIRKKYNNHEFSIKSISNCIFRE